MAKTVPSKKGQKDIENSNEILAIYVLKEFSNKLDIPIYDCIGYHSEFMNEILEEKLERNMIL